MNLLRNILIFIIHYNEKNFNSFEKKWIYVVLVDIYFYDSDSDIIISYFCTLHLRLLIFSIVTVFVVSLIRQC